MQTSQGFGNAGWSDSAAEPRPHVWAETLEASRSEVNKTRQLCPGGHGLRCDLGLQFRRALQGQAAEIAADQKVSAEGNHGNEEQREPTLRFHCGEHG